MECSKCCVALLFLLGFCRVDGIPLARFYTFGRTAGDASLRPNDDGSSPAISLNVSFPFFDMLHSTVYVRLLLYTYGNHSKHRLRKLYAGTCRQACFTELCSCAHVDGALIRSYLLGIAPGSNSARMIFNLFQTTNLCYIYIWYVFWGRVMD